MMIPQLLFAQLTAQLIDASARTTKLGGSPGHTQDGTYSGGIPAEKARLANSFTSTAQAQRVSNAIRDTLGPNRLFTITPDTTRNLTGDVLNRNYDFVNAQSYNARSDANLDLGWMLDLGVSKTKVTAGADIENVNFYDGDPRRFLIPGRAVMRSHRELGAGLLLAWGKVSCVI